MLPDFVFDQGGEGEVGTGTGQCDGHVRPLGTTSNPALTTGSTQEKAQISGICFLYSWSNPDVLRLSISRHNRRYFYNRTQEEGVATMLINKTLPPCQNSSSNKSFFKNNLKAIGTTLKFNKIC